jgi:propionyl-CoA carboxylase beta chain
MMMLRELMSFLPSNNMEDPPRKVCTDDLSREIPKLDTIVPDDPNKPYDMKDILLSVIDDGHFL